MSIVETPDARQSRLWNAIQSQLDRDLPDWKGMIKHFDQVGAVERRQAGERWSDKQVFEALVRAVLSNNTNWLKVEAVLPALQQIFAGYDHSRFAMTTRADIEMTIVPWFKARKAGSMTLKRSLMSLVETAGIMSRWGGAQGTLESYFLGVVSKCGGDPKRAAIALGSAGSRSKLPGLGIPIAAETLRNMGFDICKPDRHMCRAVGSFNLVQFDKWPDKAGTKPPIGSENEMLETMAVVERLARLNDIRVSYLDNAIWLLCARMGLYLSNQELATLASSRKEC